MGLMELTGMDKMVKLAQIVKQLGGVRAAIKQRFLMDQTRVGELVGEDRFGNKYYKNDAYFMPRNRWVQYNEKVWLDYDSSQVPPEWHRWLHHITDDTPIEKPPNNPKWVLQHAENTSIYAGHKYVPYSTTRAKIQEWEPGQRQQRHESH